MTRTNNPTWDQLPSAAQAKARRALAELPADWHIAQITEARDPHSATWLLFLDDAGGQRVSTVSVFCPIEELGPGWPDAYPTEYLGKPGAG